MQDRQPEIIEILARVLELEPGVLEGLGADADLTEQYLSSVLVVKLIVELELHFGLQIDDEDLLTENVSTFEKIGRLLDKYQTNQQTAG